MENYIPVIVSGLISFFIAVFLLRYFTIKRHGIYSQRGIGIIHWPKWFLHCFALWWKRRQRNKRLNNYSLTNPYYEASGFVPTFSEQQMENPKSLITDRHDDGIFVWGGDIEGRTIMAKVVRLSGNRACTTLFVKMADGTLFTLPHQPDTNVNNIENENSWQGSGMLLECVEPMRTWRIKFNGFLRRGTRTSYVTNDEDDDDDLDFTKPAEDREIIEARLDLLWRAARAPVDIWNDSSPRLLADSLAREPGADSTTYEALERDGYDQWGVLHGTVQLGTQPEQTWYLRGARQHRWGMCDSATNLHRCVNFFMNFQNGNMAWIEAFSYKSLISHGVFGYVLTASGKYYPMTYTNVELADMGEDGEIPKNVCFEFNAGGQNYQCWNQLNLGVQVHTGDPWTLAHEYRPTSAVSTILGEGWGLAIFSKRFNDLCPVPEKRNLFVQRSLETPPDGEFVISLDDEYCTCVPLTGGKGASLAYLSNIARKVQEPNLKFRVPKGVVVTSDAWEKQVKDSPELIHCISTLQKAVTSLQSPLIKEACERMQKVLTIVTVCETVVDCLKEELINIFSSGINSTKFAVRSSASSEDSEESSSAGQNETFLGCFWEGSGTTILKALIKCWASQFTFQSIEYKRQRGQPLNDGMAVVVQQMVDPTAAGVLFTRNPVTGSPASFLISANFGLGESIVSATSDPDSILVQRTWRKKFNIANKTIGDKKIKYVMEDKGGTKEVAVEDNDRQSICLTDGDSLRLARIGLFVEECYGAPRDIEFAIQQNEIYLLQARPITSLFSWTDYELKHEIDSPILSDKEINTTANTGEVFPGYICPLTLSTVVKALDIGLQKNVGMYEWPTYKIDFSYLRTISVHLSNCFLDFGEICLRLNEEKLTMVNRAVDLAVCGRIVTTTEMLKWATGRFGIIGSITKAIRTAISFYGLFTNSSRVKKCRPLYSNYEINTKRVTSSVSLYKKICRRLPELINICNIHTHTSSSSTMTQCIALVMMAENENEISLEMIQDIGSLLCCISQTESADVPSSLEVMAKTVAECEEANDFLSMSIEEGRVWLESDPEEVGTTFREFIAKHGHRCIKEFDLKTLSWGMAPESLVSTLQSMVKHQESFKKLKNNTDIATVLNSMELQKSGSKKRGLEFIIKTCGSAVTLREATKSMVIKTVDAFRKAYRTLGLLMVSECRIPDAELIFFFQNREIGVLLESRSAALVTKAINRRKLMKEIESMAFEELNFGVPIPIKKEDDFDVRLNPSESMKGTPVCHGTVRGPARVVTSVKDAENIQNGDILITYCTDVGWTPYFPLLSGVITEIGGLISHGAVVAREYGLPCVVGVKGATRAFNSGDLILLNGKEGTVQNLCSN